MVAEFLAGGKCVLQTVDSVFVILRVWRVHTGLEFLPVEILYGSRKNNCTLGTSLN